MRLGISAFAWTREFKKPHLDLIPKIKRLGLHAIEIPMFEPSALPAKEIRKAVESQGLECTVCAILPAGKNPISPDRQERKDAITHLRKCIEVCAEMGSELLGGPLFAPIGYLPEHRPTDSEWLWATQAFQALLDSIETNNITLSIEPVNRSETSFIRTAADAKRLCELIGSPRIGVTIDTFHANIEELSFSDAIRSLGSHLKHIHVSENDRGPLGRGHIPFVEIVNSIREIDYSSFLMIEGFGYSAIETNAPGTLWAHRDISPETLAEESTAYLRGILGEAAL